MTKEGSQATSSTETALQSHDHPAQFHSTSLPRQKPAIGECVAVLCDKYTERPLLGRVTEVIENNVKIDWLIGSYSGNWREWKGREQGKTVIYSETLPLKNILLYPITLTKSMKLPLKTIAELKELYAYGQKL